MKYNYNHLYFYFFHEINIENLYFESNFVQVEFSLLVQDQKVLLLKSVGKILEWETDSLPIKRLSLAYLKIF